MEDRRIGDRRAAPASRMVLSSHGIALPTISADSGAPVPPGSRARAASRPRGSRAPLGLTGATWQLGAQLAGNQRQLVPVASDRPDASLVVGQDHGLVGSVRVAVGIREA